MLKSYSKHNRELTKLIILFVINCLLSSETLYAQTNNFKLGKSNQSIGTNRENMRTNNYKVGQFGWLSAAIQEQHPEFYYPSFTDYNAAGWFILDPHNVGRGDFDGDGKQDLMISWAIFPHTIERNVRATFTVLLNNGDGSLRYAPEIFENDTTLRRFFCYRAAVADFNMDGRDDIVAGSMGMIKRNPDGTYTNKFEPIPLALSTPEGKLKDASGNIEGQEKGGLPKDFSFAHDLAVGDVSGDGAPDIYQGKILLINNGKGFFKNLTDSLQGEMRPNSAYLMSSAIGDLNNDGIGDIVAAYSDGAPNNESGYIMMSKNGDKSFKKRELIKLPPGIFSPGNNKFNFTTLCDIDNNGFKDIIIAVTRANPYYEGRKIQVIMNKGNGLFVDETNIRVKSKDYLEKAHGEGSLYVADVNNDGQMDIIHSSKDQETHGVTIYLNKGGILEVMDDSVLAWVQNWQIKGFENLRNPNSYNKSEKMYPLDLDGKGGIDFISLVTKPHMVWPPIEATEFIFYSILSLGNCKATKPLFDKTNFSFCTGDSLKLSISNFNKGDSLFWNTNNKIEAAQSKTKYFRNTDKLFVTLKDSMGCTATSDTISLIRNSLPATPTITKDSGNNLVSTSTFGNLWYKDGVATSDTTQIIKPSLTGTYSVKSIQNGCYSLLSSSYYYVITGISELEDGKYIKFFPNPTQESIEISHNLNDLKTVNISLYDSNGRILLGRSDIMDGQRISLQGLQNGVYLVRLFSSDGKNNVVSKIIKL